MEDKNYEVEVAPETPFPGEPLILPTQVQPSQGGNYSPTTSKEQSFKRKRTAVELLSTALNTRSKKILQEFALQDSGGFKVGDFKSGVSGDLRITPNGLTARNISGITTFAIDGDTGDAIFLGTIRAGTVIATEIDGDLITTGKIQSADGLTYFDLDGDEIQIANGDDTTIIDATGLVSTANFASSNANASPGTTFTTATYVAISGSDLTFTLDRSARVVVLLTIQSAHAQTTGGSDMSGRVFYTVHADNTAKLPEILIDASLVDATGVKENVFRKVYSTSMLLTLAAGSHTINARYKIDSAVNITATLNTWDLTVVILGN